MKKLISFGLMAFAVVSMVGAPQVRADGAKGDDAVFTQAKSTKQDSDDGFVQIVLGAVDLGMSKTLYSLAKEMTIEDAGVARAESELSDARNSFTSEAEREGTITRLRLEYRNMKQAKVNHEHSDIISIWTKKNESKLIESEVSLVKAEKSKIITAAEKADLISSAEDALTLAQKLAKDAGASKTMPKFVRGLKLIGSGAFAVDALGRIYVWSVLDKNPTFSPVVTYLSAKAKGSSSKPGENHAAAESSQYLDHYDSRKPADAPSSGRGESEADAGGAQIR